MGETRVSDMKSGKAGTWWCPLGAVFAVLGAVSIQRSGALSVGRRHHQNGLAKNAIASFHPHIAGGWVGVGAVK